MTVFRPCIDLHDGHVKQIVGGTLRDDGPGPETNFVADRDARWYAERYRDDGLRDGHVILLGPGNEEAARGALAAFPGGLQLGGGVTIDSAPGWVDAGAGRVIVTSWLFDGDELVVERARELANAVGREQVVIDLSCRRVDDGWRVATNRWQTVTSAAIGAPLFEQLAEHCSEFLVHAADVEGKQAGIDEALVSLLGEACPIPCTYAGGGRTIDDLARVESLSGGRVHLTFGSALDLFGGTGVRYADCVAWNQRVEAGA